MKIIPNFIRTLIWRAFTYSSMIILAFLGFIVSFGNRKIIRAFERLWSSFILAVGGVRVQVSGLDNIPKRTVVFMPNHQSDLDWPIILSVMPGDYVFLAKKELFKVPIFGRWMKFAGHLPIERTSVVKVYSALRMMIRALENGQSLVIFPEGTRTPDGRLGQFGQANFKIIEQTGVPVVPIVIDGSFKALRKGNPIIKPAKVKLKILKPIFFNKEKAIKGKEFCAAAAGEVRSAIQKELEK